MTVKELKEILNQLPEDMEGTPVFWEHTNIKVNGLEVCTMEVYMPFGRLGVDPQICLFGDNDIS